LQDKQWTPTGADLMVHEEEEEEEEELKANSRYSKPLKVT